MMDPAGRRLAKARLPEGVAGMARLHAMIGEQLGEDTEVEVLGEDTEVEVLVGIETDRGPWVAALIAAGYQVCMGSTRCRWPGTENGTAFPGPKATPPMRISWPIWCVPIPTSCARWPGIRHRPKRSRW